MLEDLKIAHGLIPFYSKAEKMAKLVLWVVLIFVKYVTNSKKNQKVKEDSWGNPVFYEEAKFCWKDDIFPNGKLIIEHQISLLIKCWLVLG